MEKDKTKTPRVSQTRAKQEKPKVWSPPSALDAPPAPDGYRHRWLRTELMGTEDTKNMSGKLRSGWELVRGDEYPEDLYPTVDSGKYQGVIGVGGLVLARISEELAQSREEYFRKMTQDRDEALDNDVLKDQHPGVPINQDRQSRVSFGGSKK